MTHLKTRTRARLDSLLAVASDEDRAVYLLMTPVSADPRRALLYRELLDFIG